MLSGSSGAWSGRHGLHSWVEAAARLAWGHSGAMTAVGEGCRFAVSVHPAFAFSQRQSVS